MHYQSDNIVILLSLLLFWKYLISATFVFRLQFREPFRPISRRAIFKNFRASFSPISRASKSLAFRYLHVVDYPFRSATDLRQHTRSRNCITEAAIVMIVSYENGKRTRADDECLSNFSGRFRFLRKVCVCGGSLECCCVGWFVFDLFVLMMGRVEWLVISVIDLEW